MLHLIERKQMRFLSVFWFIILSLQSFSHTPEIPDNLNTAANVGYLSPLEKEIIYEINLFRSNPSKYAQDFIAPIAKNYTNRLLHYPGDRLAIRTSEGVNALNECVRVLSKESAKPLMFPNPELHKAARDHQKDQSKSGKTGHTGSDNSNLRTRIERYGQWQKRIAENIAYGNTSARQVIIFLLIDDGVKSRGHRVTLLNPDLKFVGVACGSHPEYNTICVMDFAGGMMEK